MSRDEPDREAGRSFLGFMYRVLGDGPRFWRLMALVVVLLIAYALAKGDVAALYDHYVQTAPLWAKWGIPPGGASVTLGTMGYRRLQRALEQKREAKAEKRELQDEKRQVRAEKAKPKAKKKKAAKAAKNKAKKKAAKK
jgi:hypothetical protein